MGGDDIARLAVTIAKRVCDLAGPGQVLVSQTVRINMLGSPFEFNDPAGTAVEGRARCLEVVLRRRATPARDVMRPQRCGSEITRRMEPARTSCRLGCAPRLIWGPQAPAQVGGYGRAPKGQWRMKA